jgi:hypothetical protein
MTPANPSCETPRELSTLNQRLPRLAEALRGPGEVSIVAIGSSSTVGEGTISKETPIRTGSPRR